MLARSAMNVVFVLVQSIRPGTRKGDGKHGAQVLIYFKGDYLFCPFGNRAGERARAATYFNDGALFCSARAVDYRSEQVGIGYKVLPELLFEPEPLRGQHLAYLVFFHNFPL